MLTLNPWSTSALTLSEFSASVAFSSSVLPLNIYIFVGSCVMEKTPSESGGRGVSRKSMSNAEIYSSPSNDQQISQSEVFEFIDELADN